MTDFFESNLESWRALPCLQRFIASGHLDFAVFDALDGTDFTLQQAGVRPRVGCCWFPLLHSRLARQITLNASTLRNPLIIVANYVFDTLPHDVYQVGLFGVKSCGGFSARDVAMTVSWRCDLRRIDHNGIVNKESDEWW